MENGEHVKSPAFQIYPADFLADKNTLVMTTVEIGAYWLLLLVCWQENGLTDDLGEMAVIARLPLKQFTSVWERRIQRCFTQRVDGKWTHKRLEKERQKQAENREKRQRAGQKGAEARWQTDSNAIANAYHKPNSGSDSAMAKNGLSDFSFQSSISTSTSSSGKKAERPAKKQQDERRNHPAIRAFVETRGSYPLKDAWDLVIRSVGDEPDLSRMRDCWLAWRGKGYKPQNLDWLVDWYVNGIPTNGVRASVPSGLAAAERVRAKYEQRS